MTILVVQKKEANTAGSTPGKQIPILIDEDKSLLALCDEVLGFFSQGICWN